MLSHLPEYFLVAGGGAAGQQGPLCTLKENRQNGQGMRILMAC